MQNNWTSHEDMTVPTPAQPLTQPPRTPLQGSIPAPTTPNYNQQHIPPPPPLARESAARARMRQRRMNGRGRGGEWAWVIVALALLSVVIVLSMSVSLFVRASQDQTGVIPTSVAMLPTPVDARTDFSSLDAGANGSAAAGDRLTLDDGRTIVLTPWDGESRFTILAMGLDRRPNETGLAYRTDTMMLISIDPVGNSIGILSIPRDLYVEVPGYSQLQRVNSPMVLGELQQPGYGPRLAMQTVQYNLGIRVHEYAIVDFRTVITVIDAIGGIDIDVRYRIVDYQMPDLYYGFDPLILEPGLQHMNGYTALRYARTRHGDSDLARAQRQQDVLYAIRDRVLNLNMLPQLIINTPSMLANLSENVYTGLSVDQIIQLALYAQDIPVENIRTGVIDGSYVMPYMTPQGASVLIPNRSMLGRLMVEVFGENYSE
ncbi:MAG: LCP family protein [Chloroflexota bacterium]|nr:LCP family protein [Chloroflexota bacterium]